LPASRSQFSPFRLSPSALSPRRTIPRNTVATIGWRSALDARLAGFKAALKLNSDQEKSWGLFENAVRDGAKARAENMRAMRERRESDEEPSPIDRMRMMSDRLAKRSAAVKSLADAATPLYVSLDDGQKRDFGLLFRDLVHRGRHHHG
jgi:hypothetical protein